MLNRIQSTFLFAGFLLLTASLLPAGEPAACGVCNGTGVKTSQSLVKTVDTHQSVRGQNADTTIRQVERTVVHKEFCPNCEDGKTLCREAYQILLVVPGQVENNIIETQRQIPGWKGRVESSQRQMEQTEKDLSEYRSSKADVRDQITKIETQLKNVKAENEKARLKHQQLEEQMRDLKVQQEYAKAAMDQVKKRLSEYGLELPAPERRKPPIFPLRTFTDLASAASPALKKGSDPAAAAATTPAKPVAKGNMKTYVLNDGRELKVRIAMENGEEVMLKCEDGSTVNIKKSEIKGITTE